jgi:diaminohydroxyphosphoribosylaminopyrimidine deaminase/5-amino-6-(5-phosphoribosylamino)uracil reductase
MLRAFEISKKGKLTSYPNPWVGCVIIKNNKIIGEGYHSKAGTEHAEVIAIKNCVESCEGSTMYVTLEPCCHQGKTPPCVDKIIDVGIKKVVYSIKDPDNRVSGRGIEYLLNKGIEVEQEFLQEIEDDLRSYIHHRKTGLPYIILKTALSLDGCFARKDKKSKWITGIEARDDVQKLREESQGIIVGVTTALYDNPYLTVRNSKNTPLRIVLDKRGELKTGNLLDQSIAKTLILTSNDVNKETLKLWESLNIKVLFGEIEDLLKYLGSIGMLQVIVEGGNKIYETFINKNLVNELVIYRGNVILGYEGLKCFNLDIHNLNFRFKLKETKIFGNDIKSTYIFINNFEECVLFTTTGKWNFRCYENSDRVLIKNIDNSRPLFLRIHSDRKSVV